MITGIYDLIADLSWSLLQFQEVRLECDTTLGPVTINLPSISTLSQSTNLKLIIVDATANASSNNITINSGTTGVPPVSDTFNDSSNNQIVLNTDGSSIEIQNIASTQWIGIESVSSGGGSSNPFGELTSNEPFTCNITNAVEGTSIPDGATDQYVKTIPLTGLGSNVTTALVVFNSYEAFNSASMYAAGNGFGVTSGGFSSLDGQGSIGFTYNMVEVGARLLVTANFQDAKRTQSFPNGGSAREVNETGKDLIPGTNPNYTQIGGTMIGKYSFTNRSIGYSSDNTANTQNHSVLKSAYLDNSGVVSTLILILKKYQPTTGLTWSTLRMNVYDLSS